MWIHDYKFAVAYLAHHALSPLPSLERSVCQLPLYQLALLISGCIMLCSFCFCLKSRFKCLGFTISTLENFRRFQCLCSFVISSVSTGRCGQANVLGRDSHSMLSSLILATSRLSNAVELLVNSPFIVLIVSEVFFPYIKGHLSVGPWWMCPGCNYSGVHRYELFCWYLLIWFVQEQFTYLWHLIQCLLMHILLFLGFFL